MELSIIHKDDLPNIKLYRYSDSENIEFRVYDNQRDFSFINKPDGLWVSDENEYGWKQWCLDNHFNVENLKFEVEIFLKDNAKILHIKNKEELVLFFDTYKTMSSFAHFPILDDFLISSGAVNWGL